MPLPLKIELETWADALRAYDAQDYEGALELFLRIAQSSKVFTNMGLIYAAIGRHEAAIEQYAAATALDPYLAIAYFQSGVSNFALARYDFALRDFEDTFLYLRGNREIDYKQLGLGFKLFSCEVLFNRGLAKLCIGAKQDGLSDLRDAARSKVVAKHAIIDEAVRNGSEGHAVFAVPIGTIYRPSQVQLANSTTKDYIGEAELIAAAETKDACTEFSGIQRMKTVQGEEGSSLGRSLTMPTTWAEPSHATSTSPAPRLHNGISAGGILNLLMPSPNIPQSRVVATPHTRKTDLSRGMSARKASSPQLASPIARRQRQLQKPKPLVLPAPNVPSSHQPESSPNHQYFLDDYLNTFNELSDDLREFILEPASTHEPHDSSSNDDVNLAENHTRPRYFDDPHSQRKVSPVQTQGLVLPSSATLTQPSSPRKVVRQREQRVMHEDEEGYGTGSDEEWQMSIIKTKLHYQGDVRGMIISPTTPWREFVTRVTCKFGTSSSGLKLRFKDEDGVEVSLYDDSDFALAIATAHAVALGRREGRLEVWCTDI
ncbi:hypothetical protein CONPUDRAFT_108764 [Coniophora puteana RWD-64-598 SS2]|uniref:PB1 domain-containing protein n=1 Tax=Coniophora puteana (strain RWD-64-598) TaxID=741705 RepID=A0A5M3MHS5_CONPW|nr:uncharacterized protein CONPUDRAFT_108764 [Coniophora puteana RWD-64-598 SS2]EIW78752.1 hypothetical protein CONPUDRAFT_108764 [Coniophora puteana RWD-64-598 SS2]